MDHLLQEIGIRQDFSNVLLIMALIMARVLPLILYAPFIGGDLVPSQVKLGVGLTLSLLLFPYVSQSPIPPGPIGFVLLMVKEVFIGLTIAFASTMAFEAARAAGTFVDTMSGANQATVFVPQIQQQASLFADFKFQLTIVIFLGLNGHHVVIQSLFESFKVIPLDAFPRFGHGFWPLFENVLRMVAQFLVITVALAAPAALACFLTDLTLGAINRVAPQIQVFFISQSIKPMVVTAITLAALVVLYERFLDTFRLMLVHIRDLIVLFV